MNGQVVAWVLREADATMRQEQVQIQSAVARILDEAAGILPLVIGMVARR